MNIERDTVVEIAVSTTAVVLFTIALIGVGSLYYNNGFSPSGAIALVSTVAGFVVLMLVVSYFLAGR
jgi:uncharacterized membrane protein YcjF (UPF0283 family)